MLIIFLPSYLQGTAQFVGLLADARDTESSPHSLKNSVKKTVQTDWGPWSYLAAPCFGFQQCCPLLYPSPSEMSKTTLVENLWHQEALFRLILLFPPPMLPRTEPALAPAGQHALLQISEVTHTHSVLTRATQHGLTHKCRQCEPDSALFPLALAAEAAFRNDGITVTWGRIIYHLVLSTKNNKKKNQWNRKQTWVVVILYYHLL